MKGQGIDWHMGKCSRRFWKYVSIRLLRSGSSVDLSADRSGLTINSAGGHPPPLMLSQTCHALLPFEYSKGKRGSFEVDGLFSEFLCLSACRTYDMHDFALTPFAVV